MFAVSVDGAMYTIRYSPLGLLCNNVMWGSHDAPLRDGVRLYERQKDEDPWVHIQWPAQLWWIRFLLVGHCIFLGSRQQPICCYQNTGRFHEFWLRRTTPMEQRRFFSNPDVKQLVRHLRLHVNRQHHSWLHGHHGSLNALLHIYRAVRKQHPVVLRPCGDEQQWQSSPVRGAMVLKELLQTMEQPVTAAFTIPLVVFDHELMGRYGCSVSEVTASRAASMVPFPCTPAGVTIQRYRELNCSVLDVHGDCFITLASVEQSWSTFANSLCRLIQRAQVVLLDAPMQARRLVHTMIHERERAAWIVDSPATITNVREEIGADATIPRYYVPVDVTVLVVDGLHRMSLRQQADLLQKALSMSNLQVVVLGVDKTGRGLVHGRALDGWSLCCHALHIGGGKPDVLNVTDRDGLRNRWASFRNAPESSLRLAVWQVECMTTSSDFEQCLNTQDTCKGTKRRWLCAPVPNCHLVSWVCQNVAVSKGTMLVVNWESDCRTMAAQSPQVQRIAGFELCDQTEPYVGQDVRCVGALRGRMRVGEVLRVVGPVDEGTGIALQQGNGTVVRAAKDELQKSCRPARLSPLYEQLNSYYAKRPVMVLLSHTSNHGPAMRQEWDPLYTGLGLGGVRNVTIVANQQGLEAARCRMLQVLASKPPDIPRIWQDFVVTLVHTGVEKKASLSPRRERKKDKTSC